MPAAYRIPGRAAVARSCFTASGSIYESEAMTAMFTPSEVLADDAPMQSPPFETSTMAPFWTCSRTSSSVKSSRPPSARKRREGRALQAKLLLGRIEDGGDGAVLSKRKDEDGARCLLRVVDYR
jgi:hypothetical protein